MATARPARKSDGSAPYSAFQQGAGLVEAYGGGVHGQFAPAPIRGSTSRATCREFSIMRDRPLRTRPAISTFSIRAETGRPGTALTAKRLVIRGATATRGRTVIPGAAVRPSRRARRSRRSTSGSSSSSLPTISRGGFAAEGSGCASRELLSSVLGSIRKAGMSQVEWLSLEQRSGPRLHQHLGTAGVGRARPMDRLLAAVKNPVSSAQPGHEAA